MTNINQSNTPTNDVAAIQRVFEQLVAAWNHADGAAYGALFTDDADYIDVTGRRTRGGDTIGQVHQFLFNGPLKGSMLGNDGEPMDIQFVTPDVAIVVATGAARLAGQEVAPTDRQSINTNVLVKRDGVWRIRAFQNSRVQPFEGRPAQASGHNT